LEQTDEFYYEFYSALFRIAPETREIFDLRKTSMKDQHVKLHHAIGVLANFRPTDYPNPISPCVEHHRTLGIRPEYFDAFRDAFLSSLRQLGIESDDNAIDAWRAIFDMAIPYIAGIRAAGGRPPSFSDVANPSSPVRQNDMRPAPRGARSRKPVRYLARSATQAAAATG
jgi:hemoglobin-like flavoprotein